MEAAAIEPEPGQSQEPTQELDWAGLLPSLLFRMS